VKKINILLLTVLLLCFTGCEDKKPETTLEKNKDTVSEKNVSKQEHLSKEEIEIRKKHTFILNDMHDDNHTVSIENKRLEISNVKEKLVLVNFFATWCPPCRGEIPYLADLQKKYKGDLFIAGILVNDTPDNKDLNAFIERYGINYYLSTSEQNDAFAELVGKRLKVGEDFPLPLTILIKNGYYYSHYEGAVPVEMLEYNIKKAMSKE
jgi:thiol-disulfide isomerase/thioredoxin